jgi:hypothetical protein
VTDEIESKKPRAKSAPSADRVSSADIRDKLEELKDSAATTVSKGGAVYTVGALLGAAAAVVAAYLAGRRSCR